MNKFNLWRKRRELKFAIPEMRALDFLLPRSPCPSHSCQCDGSRVCPLQRVLQSWSGSCTISNALMSCSCEIDFFHNYRGAHFTDKVIILLIWYILHTQNHLLYSETPFERPP